MSTIVLRTALKYRRASATLIRSVPVHSARFPERGHFCWLKDKLSVDLTMEQLFTHNQVKAEVAEVVRPIVKAAKREYYLVDGVRLTNTDVDLSTCAAVS